MRGSDPRVSDTPLLQGPGSGGGGGRGEGRGWPRRRTATGDRRDVPMRDRLLSHPNRGWRDSGTPPRGWREGPRSLARSCPVDSLLTLRAPVTEQKGLGETPGLGVQGEPAASQRNPVLQTADLTGVGSVWEGGGWAVRLVGDPGSQTTVQRWTAASPRADRPARERPRPTAPGLRGPLPSSGRPWTR